MLNTETVFLPWQQTPVFDHFCKRADLHQRHLPLLLISADFNKCESRFEKNG